MEETSILHVGILGLWFYRSSAVPYNGVPPNNTAEVTEVDCTAQNHCGGVRLLRRLVASLSPPRPGFDSRVVCMGVDVDKIALGQAFSSRFGFSLSPLLHHHATLIHLPITKDL